MITSLVLEENVRIISAREAEGQNLGAFKREITRMQEYDDGVCPERWQSAISYIKQQGFQNLDVLKRFGERQYGIPVSDLETIATISKSIGEGNAKIKDSCDRIRFTLPNGWKNILLEDEERFSKLPKTETTEFQLNGSTKRAFLLPDQIKGFSFLFGYESGSSLKNPFLRVNLAGQIDNKRMDLGEVSTEELESISKRRFMYLFGTQPASNNEIIDALVKLNGLPKNGARIDKPLPGTIIEYKLEERNIDKLKTPRAARLVYDEALAAKDAKLFSEVKVFELVGQAVKLPKKDPVIVGIDHFGNKYPIIYWAGDQCLGGIR